MQISEIKAEGALTKSYRVVVEAADIARATERELKALGAKVKIPGFRPGNVPMKVLQQRYGAGVQGDVIKNVVSDGTEKAIRDNKLRIAMKPEVNVENYEEGGSLTFTVKVETLPEIPEVNFSGITLTRETFEIEAEAMENALKLLSDNNREPKALPAATKATQGHVVTMDFVGKVDGVAFEGGTAEGFTIEIGSGRLIPGFEDQLVGAKAGDKVEVKVPFPENYFNKELAGKPATFDVTVKEVSELVAPVLDDAFATARGLKDLEALKDAVREQLSREYHDIVRTRLKKRLFDALEAEVSYPLPESMVKLEFDAIWSRLQQAKATEGEEVFEGKPEAEVKAEYEKIAQRRVRLGLLLADIGQKQKIAVSREEISRAVMEQASQFPGQEKAVFDFYRKNPNRLEELRGPILEEKAVDWVLSQVKTEDTKVTTKELAESGYDLGDAEDAPKKKSAAPKKKTAKKDED